MTTRRLLFGALAVVLATVLPALPASAKMSVRRIGATDPAANAVTLAGRLLAQQAANSTAPPTVYVASAENFPDALVAGPAAGLADAPLYLVLRDAIPAATANDLARVHPGHIFVLGGPNAVSDAVVAQMQSLAPGVTITRIGGADRYETAAKVSAASFMGPVDTVFIATGVNFPDALAAGAAAGHLGGPVLLVSTTQVPAATAAELTRLEPSQIVVVGGVNAIPDSVVGQLDGFGAKIVRVAGADRYLTSVELSKFAFSPIPSEVFVATGDLFIDALIAGPVAVNAGGPIFLVPTVPNPLEIPEEMRQELKRLGAPNLTIVGPAADVPFVTENVLVGLVT